MPSRELTDDEEDRLLTQEEVNNLDERTEVMVKWNGGNGPHRYTIGFRDGVKSPYTEDTRTGELTGPPLDYVGEKPRQRVFLPNNNPEETAEAAMDGLQDAEAYCESQGWTETASEIAELYQRVGRLSLREET